MITGLFTRFMDNSDRVGGKSLLDYGAIDNDHVHAGQIMHYLSVSLRWETAEKGQVLNPKII